MRDEKSFERTLEWFLRAMIVAGLLAAVALVILATNLGEDLMETWLGTLIEMLFAVLGTAASLFASYWFCEQLFVRISKRLDSLEYKYEDELKQLRRRVPTWIVTMTLLSNGVLLIADKSFSGDVLMTVTIGLLLLLVFWIANELATTEQRIISAIGYVLFLGGILYLFVVALWYHDWSLQDFALWIWGLDAKYKLSLGLTTLLYASLPFLTYKISRASRS